MNKLATDCKPMLAYMFYTGALTYVPFLGDTTAYNQPYKLRIPNNVA
jgi:hypothetical protein